MKIDTMVFWSVRRLAKEYGLSPHKVGVILHSIGAKHWSKSNNGNPIWYWEA